MSAARPPVWLERHPLPAVAAEVHAAVTVLGPGEDRPADPFGDVAEAVGIVAGAYHYGADVLERAPSLRVLARTGIGVDRVDVAAATARGVVVCNAPDGPTVSTAEHAVTLMLAAAKGIKPSEAALRAGSDGLYSGHRAVELDGKRLGLVGCGRIARRVAAAARGLGMEVTAHDPYLAAADFPPGVAQAASLEEALDADVVSVHVPLVEATRGMFDEAAFGAMRPGAVFVNTARGELVDQEALLLALDSGHLLAAALDVTVPEPLPADHPLLHRDDVIVTPHVASATPESRERIFRIAFSEVLAVLHGERPRHAVNPDVLDRAGAA